MILLLVLPLIVCFSGDSEVIKVDFDDVKNTDTHMMQNKSIQITTAQVDQELQLCGETPGLCNESMIDIDIIINRTVNDIYISVHTITVLLIVCIIIQFITAVIILKAVYFTKRRIQYNLNRRNRIVPQNVFDPLISGV